MDQIKVLKRAWEITWRYRALWVFGIILALTTGGGLPPRGDGGNGGAQYQFDGEDFFGPNGRFPVPGFTMPEVPTAVVSLLIAIGVALACVTLIVIIASVVARFVSEAALLRMVDDYEQTGEQHSVRQGFRVGWSRSAWRLFLINLLVVGSEVVAFILLFALVLLPLLAWITQSTIARVIGTVAAIGLFFLVLLIIIVVGTATSLLLRFFRRACALEGLGVIDSIRRGFELVRKHLGDVALMWLIMLGVRIGLTIATIAAVILLFPVILALIVLGAVLGGVPALVVGGLTSLLLEGAVPWVLAGVIGLPIFILVMAVPWLFLGGVVEVFKSSVWTLTYRELRALEGLAQESEGGAAGELAALDTPGVA